jgi:hypothetical protein
LLKCLLIFACLYLNTAFTQTVEQFEGRWSFTGLRTTAFKVRDNKLYVAMVEYTDTASFNRFVRRLPLDSSMFSLAAVSAENDTVLIDVDFPSIDHRLSLRYTPSDPDHIWYTGDVFFDSTRIISTNLNCSLARPACINRLYDDVHLKELNRLKTSESFTRDDAFEFLLRLNEKLKSHCNRCYAGFTDAYMNEVLMEMGFNPIVKQTANRSVWYNTSGFTFFLKQKFYNDERLIKLIDYVFDWYLKGSN